jgi:hypothetical protein
MGLQGAVQRGDAVFVRILEGVGFDPIEGTRLACPPQQPSDLEFLLPPFPPLFTKLIILFPLSQPHIPRKQLPVSLLPWS